MVSSVPEKKKRGKTHDNTGMVTDVLLEIIETEKVEDFDIIDSIAEHFTRILNLHEEQPEEWREVPAVLLAKTKNVLKPKNLRPISICNNIGKLYRKILYKMLNEAHPTEASATNQFALPGMQAQEMIHILKLLTEKSKSFGKHFCIIAIDIQQAFDSTKHLAMLIALLHTQVDT